MILLTKTHQSLKVTMLENDQKISKKTQWKWLATTSTKTRLWQSLQCAPTLHEWKLKQELKIKLPKNEHIKQKTQENTCTKWNAWEEYAPSGEVHCLLKLFSSNLELAFWQLQKSKFSNWFTFKASCAQEYH